MLSSLSIFQQIRKTKFKTPEVWFQSKCSYSLYFYTLYCSYAVSGYNKILIQIFKTHKKHVIDIFA